MWSSRPSARRRQTWARLSASQEPAAPDALERDADQAADAALAGRAAPIRVASGPAVQRQAAADPFDALRTPQKKLTAAEAKAMLDHYETLPARVAWSLGLRFEAPVTDKDAFVRLGVQSKLHARLFGSLYGDLRGGYMWGVHGGASSGATVGGGSPTTSGRSSSAWSTTT